MRYLNERRTKIINRNEVSSVERNHSNSKTAESKIIVICVQLGLETLELRRLKFDYKGIFGLVDVDRCCFEPLKEFFI